MERLGAIVTEIELPDMAELNIAARFIQWGESTAIFSSYPDGALVGRDVWTLIEQGRMISAGDYVNAQRLRTVFRRKFDEIWRTIDALVTPTTPITAPRVNEDQVDIDGYVEDARIASTRFTRGINPLGEPAISIPCGRSAAGLPVGLQIVAPPFADAWLLRLGQVMEREVS
jgi:aspartyl-tRNA(Asn)/glutamyl-tRNA(Gln) amidotransferase subunit A